MHAVPTPHEQPRRDPHAATLHPDPASDPWNIKARPEAPANVARLPTENRALAVLRPLADLLWALESVTFAAVAALLLAVPLVCLAHIQRLERFKRRGASPSLQ